MASRRRSGNTSHRAFVAFELNGGLGCRALPVPTWVNWASNSICWHITGPERIYKSPARLISSLLMIRISLLPVQFGKMNSHALLCFLSFQKVSKADRCLPKATPFLLPLPHNEGGIVLRLPTTISHCNQPGCIIKTCDGMFMSWVPLRFQNIRNLEDRWLALRFPLWNELRLSGSRILKSKAYARMSVGSLALHKDNPTKVHVLLSADSTNSNFDPSWRLALQTKPIGFSLMSVLSWLDWVSWRTSDWEFWMPSS